MDGLDEHPIGSITEADFLSLRDWATGCVNNYSWLASGLVEILCRAADPKVDLGQAAQWHQRLSKQFSATFLRAAFDIIEMGSHQFSTATDLPDYRCVIWKSGVPPFEIGKRTFPTAHEGSRWLHDEAAQLVDVLESVNFELTPVQDSEGVWRLTSERCDSDAVNRLLLDYQPLDGELLDRLRVAIHHEWRRAVAWLRSQQPAATFEPATPSPATAKATANARMLDTISKVPESRDWTAEQFAQHLGYQSKGTIANTPAWKTLMQSRESEKLDRIQRGHNL